MEGRQPLLKIGAKFVIGFLMFGLVLLTGLVSKGMLFYMTSQVGLDIDANNTFYANLEDVEKQHISENNNWTTKSRINPLAVIKPTLSEHSRWAPYCWLWSVIFAFVVPELMTLLRIFIDGFSSAKRERPRLLDFIFVAIFEWAHAIGIALLFGSVLPYLQGMYGVMLMNCTCLMCAMLNLLSFKLDSANRIRSLLITVFAIVGQLSGALSFLVLHECTSSDISNTRHDAISWLLPMSLICTSFGWWENYVDDKAYFNVVKMLARLRKRNETANPLSHISIKCFKILVFFGTIFLAECAFSTGGIFSLDIIGKLFSSFVQDGFNEFMGSANVLHFTSPFYVFLIHFVSSLFFYWFSIFACKMNIQRVCFALPITILSPTLMVVFLVVGINAANLVHLLPTNTVFNSDESFEKPFIAATLFLFWFFSYLATACHIWNPQEKMNELLATKSKLFVHPFFSSLLLDHSMVLNRTRYPIEEENPDLERSSHIDRSSTRIIAVATMWHETKDEMLCILKSIFAMDKDQSVRRIAAAHNNVIDPHVYDFETHIYFDDAFVSSIKEGIPCRVVNSYVHQFVELMDKMNTEWSDPSVTNYPLTVSVTPYGGRMMWILPGKTKLTVHLKDKEKIRNRKRWSQVMYMCYFIERELVDRSNLENTYLLTLDGDMDFRPKAVHIVMDLMRMEKDVGIACNRSLPTGKPGPIVWYQMFEYAVGFWLLKSCECMLGNILCAPGCFSVIRALVLSDDLVMKKFYATSDKAHHFLQRDQGEDRWLCTLLIKRGYRLAYTNSSYAYTRCPETFNEFYSQRRRWILSILSNTFDLLWNSKEIVMNNTNISWFYMIFQLVLCILSLLGPGSIFLVLVNISVTAFHIDPWISLVVHLVLILTFVSVCFLNGAHVQMTMAKILSALYGLVLVAVLAHSLVSLAHGIEMKFTLPLMFFLMMACFILLAGCMHPREICCLLAGPIFLLLTPSMNMLLILYSIININAVSWGTRDSVPNADKKEINTEPANEVQDKTDVSITYSEISAQTREEKENSFEVSIISEHRYASQHLYGPAAKLSISMEIPKTLDDKNNDAMKQNLKTWNFEAENLLSSHQLTVEVLSDEDTEFWNTTINLYLSPVTENHDQKIRVLSSLTRLRNISFICFLALNFAYLSTLFGLQASNVNTTLNETTSFDGGMSEFSETLNDITWWFQANAAEVAFITVAGFVLVIQFTSMLIIRIRNLLRILAPIQVIPNNVWKVQEKVSANANSNAIVQVINEVSDSTKIYTCL